MPVAKASPVNGASTFVNSGAWLVGVAGGVACWAWMNSGLVEGCVVGWGGVPRSTDVLGTVGSPPKLTWASLEGTCVPIGGCSSLPALSIDRARNWHVGA